MKILLSVFVIATTFCAAAAHYPTRKELNSLTKAELVNYALKMQDAMAKAKGAAKQTIEGIGEESNKRQAAAQSVILTYKNEVAAQKGVIESQKGVLEARQVIIDGLKILYFDAARRARVSLNEIPEKYRSEYTDFCRKISNENSLLTISPKK